MAQILDTTSVDGKESPRTRLLNVKTLPCPENAYRWDSILRTKPTKQTLVNYATHTKLLIDHNILRRALDLSGFVLLVGPPGVGKTTMGQGFANVYATILGKPTHLFELQTKNVLSQWLGQSTKELAKAFEPVRFAAEQAPVCLLVDEIESISFARNKVINSSDPSDLVRMVDQLLKDIDSLQQYEHALVVATSNFSEVIDDALWSRADMVLRVPLPDLPTRQAILQARARILRPLGLSLESDELTALAKAAEGLSGRSLGKLFAQSYFMKGVAYDEITLDDVLDTITEAKQKERKNGNG